MRYAIRISGSETNRRSRAVGEQAPIGRAGQPVEVAPAYVYFASQESSYVSGEVIGVTGGTPLH